MDNAITRLIKVLELERKQGYRNKAVIGGLDKFASRWESDAFAEVPDPAAVSEIVSLLLGYAAVDDRPARERVLEAILVRARRAGESTRPASDAAETKTTAAHADTPALQDEEPAPLADEKPRGILPDTLVPAPSKPASTAPADARPADVRPADARPADARPADARPADARPAEVRSAGPKPYEETLSPSPTPAAVHGAVNTPDVKAAKDRAGAAGAARAETRQAARPAAPGLDAPVIRLPNVGPAFASKLAKLGVQTVRDLLYLLPRRYDDYSQLRTINQLKIGAEATVIGTVWEIKTREIGQDRKIVIARVGDGTGELQVTWFNPWIERQLRVGQAYSFGGKIDAYRSDIVMRNPEFEALDRAMLNTGRLVPVYPLTEGLSVRWLRNVINLALDAWGDDLPDFLPAAIRQDHGLMTLAQAISQTHFPNNQEQLDAALRRLSFDEFLLLQLGVLAARRQFQGVPAKPLHAGSEVVAPFLSALPYGLTAAQSRALQEILADLRREQPMGRLLQGDVGSGKTAVAAAALWIAVANGAQGAIMAPTEILAEQHARSLGRMFGPLAHPQTGERVQVLLLTGSMSPAERQEALEALATGAAHIAVGTHALIQKDVEFQDLALTVVDEQHRFGVAQRAALRQKGTQPHMLVMSATPIPRSLALTLYGDLDVSVIDEMPAGRAPIRTKWLTTTQRERAYSFIQRQVQEGRQAFIVYPLVEESENSEAKAAVEEHARLSTTIFPDLRVGLLHGRLKNEEKDAVMRAFGNGELDVLVATSVVEVGIDVPNATVIVIEGAERFGLAQLHQFRGRVGRGEHPSFCILISDVAEGEGVRRLHAVEQTLDGFELAQIDLDLRGPGDFFGTRQSGLPPLETARLSDLRTLEDARAAARALFDADPTLSLPEHAPLAERVAEFWRSNTDVS